MVKPLWKTAWRCHKKLKIELPYDPVIPLLDIYPEKAKTGTQTDTCTPIFVPVLFTIAKKWKQPKCPLADGWTDKIWYIPTMACYSAIERKDILTHATTWVYLENVMLSEIN